MDRNNSILGDQSRRRQINLDNNINEEEIFYLRIRGYGCVVTMFARLASTLAGFPISPSDINAYCNENGFFQLDTRDSWGDITLLSVEDGVKAVNGYLKKIGITKVELELQKIESLTDEANLQKLLEHYDNDPENMYLYGLRVDDSHSLTIIKDFSDFNPQHPHENNKVFKKVDTASYSFTSVNYNNLTYLYVFKIKVVPDEN